jgi:hypothetical protein
MPNHIDILIERLKQFDEVLLLELLNITAEDILTRFPDRIISKRLELFGEVEIMNPEDPELEDGWDDDYKDGFEVEQLEEEEDWDEPTP